MKLLSALGINAKILIAQLINFAVLFFVLYKFGYKPIFEFLNKRKKDIEKGVVNAEKAEKKLEEVGEHEKEVIKNAKKEALVIIEEAKGVGEEKREIIIKKAKEEIGEIINQEKAKMQTEKAETLKEIKKEIADLVVISLEKVLKEGIDEKRDKEIIQKVVKNLK